MNSNIFLSFGIKSWVKKNVFKKKKNKVNVGFDFFLHWKSEENGVCCIKDTAFHKVDIYYTF